jgi:CRISPR-associated protein Cas1
VADIYKFETGVPVAFKIAAKCPHNLEQAARIACRDLLRESRLLERIIPGIEELLSTGEIASPAAHAEAVLPAIPNAEGIGNAGHRA